MPQVDVKQKILSDNNLLARKLKAKFDEAGVFVVNLVSSPGTGKTALLERTLEMLQERGLRPAALVGDLQTDNDAVRLRKSGAPVRQITTNTMCHLEAAMVESHLDAWTLSELDFLFIENVGNLVCPASFDLGEHLRVVLLSVTEGEDKPLKYPPIFLTSQVSVVTKHDLAEPCRFDLETARANIQFVHPGMPTFVTSASSGEGVEPWVSSLIERRSAL